MLVLTNTVALKRMQPTQLGNLIELGVALRSCTRGCTIFDIVVIFFPAGDKRLYFIEHQYGQPLMVHVGRCWSGHYVLWNKLVVCVLRLLGQIVEIRSLSGRSGTEVLLRKQ